MPNQRHHIERSFFLREALRGFHLTAPILWGLIAAQVSLGAAVGLIEGWGAWSGVYFAFVTGLTVGYGDLAPTSGLTRAAAILIGFLGIAVTAVLAGIVVAAVHSTLQNVAKDT